jgi:small subunit ribosomal protein S16
VVVADGRNQRDGRFLEAIGYYDPLSDPPVVRIDTDRAAAWLKKGALPSNTVRVLLNRLGAARSAS